MQRPIKANLKTIIFVSINLIVIALIAFFEFKDIEKKQYPTFDLNWLFIVFAFLAFVIILVAATSKTLIMMKSVFGKANIKIAFENTVLGFYYSYITPLSVGGQPFQIYHFSKNGYKGSQSAAIPMTDIFANDIAMALIVIFAQVFASIPTTGITIDVGWRIASFVGLACYIAIPLCIIFFSRTPKFFKKILHFGIHILAKIRIVKNEEQVFNSSFNKVLEYTKSFDYLTDKPILLISILLLSIVQRFGFCIIPYFSIHSLGGNIPMVACIITSIIIISGVTFVPTPGNSGALEGVFYIIFSSLHQDYIFWAILIWRFFTYYSFILLGFFFAIKNSPVQIKINNQDNK